MSRSLPKVERSNITEPPSSEHSEQPAPEPPARSTLRKRKSRTVSVPRRLEGLAGVALAVAVLMLLSVSAHSLYQFPVPDSYRWYGDETWLMVAWKNLVSHGRMIVPIALESTLRNPPGLFLGSSWFTAVWYGLPQLLAPPHVDPI